MNIVRGNVGGRSGRNHVILFRGDCVLSRLPDESQWMPYQVPKPICHYFSPSEVAPTLTFAFDGRYFMLENEALANPAVMPREFVAVEYGSMTGESLSRPESSTSQTCATLRPPMVLMPKVATQPACSDAAAVEMVTLTSELIHAGERANHGFNYEQLRILGVPTPPQKGWLKNILGKKIPKSDYELFMSFRSKQNDIVESKEPNAVTLTSELLHAGASGPTGSGFCREQIESLGLKYPPRSGWLKGLVGKRIARSRYEKFLSLRKRK